MRTVTVWTVDHRAAVPLDPITSAESERASRLKSKADRRRYLVAHAALHGILAEVLAHPPTLMIDGDARPCVDGSAIDFNLSTSGALSLIATAEMRVGIDVEQIRAIADESALAKRLPSALAQLPFLQAWTIAEAVLKADGRGLFAVEDLRARASGGEWILETARGAFHARPLTVREGYAAAVAAREPFTIVRERWPR